MSYSHHFIKKVLKLLKEGHSYRKLSSRFKISTTSITNWKKGILPKGKRNKSNTKLNLEALKQDVLDYPDAYHYERANRLGVKKSCVGANLKKLNITYKKNANPSQSRRRQALLVQTEDQ